MKAKKHKRAGQTGTARLQADIALADDGTAPTEIRLLRAGVNESDYGPFLFDEISAALVMASFQADGKPRLYIDWNHGMLDPEGGRDRAAAAGSFVPEVRNGELLAADIKWTEDGKADVESRRYNLFSPAFTFEYGDDGQCRPRRLINFALVNLAGLKNIEPLLAASAAITKETATMAEEQLIEDLRTRNAALEAEIKALRSASSDIVTLGAALGTKVDAPNAERVAAASGLIALRGEVFKITGQTTPEGAIAALSAMKVNADKVSTLEAEIEKGKTAALRAELDGIWKGAVEEFKLPPADKADVEASLLALTGGKLTEGVVAAAKTYVAKLTAKVTGVGGAGPTQKDARTAQNDFGGASKMDRLMGVDAEKFTKWQVAQQEKQARQ